MKMALRNRMSALILLALPTLTVGSLAVTARAQSAASTEIGGEKLVVLSRKPVSTTKPEFTSVTVMPGRGMELLYVKANFPGKGEVNVLYSPDLATAAKMLNVEDDANGDFGYRLGAAMLCPYPNRIIGKLAPDGKTLTTSWEGRAITLPANNVGKLPGAERHAMHGMILKDKATDFHVTRIPGGEEVIGEIHDAFHGKWLAKTDLVITISLTASAIDVTDTARDVGTQSEPMAIGWHPYFAFPSGDHAQVRVHIPGTMMAQVNNYDSVFPTGKLLPVAGTPYDFRAPAGAPLDDHYYDDNWSHLQWLNGMVEVRVVDPKAHYGVAVDGISPEIKTIQLYSPPPAKFAAIEDQYNFADPFGKEWHGMNTGIVTLKPGESTKWHVRLRVFVP
jgi:aldose 1-epimerase